MPDDNTSVMESVSPPNLTQANLPAYGEPGAPEMPSTYVPAGAPTAPAAQKKPSVWSSVLQGALAGLANSGGSQHFGEGLVRGVAGAAIGQRISTEQSLQQQKLRFESARASAEMVDAFARARHEDMSSKLVQSQIDQMNLNTAAYLQDHNVTPSVTISGGTPGEITTSANGGLATIAQQTPDQTLPRLATFGSPAGVGADPNVHSIVAYHAYQPPGADKRGIVDDYLAATRGVKSADSEWMSGFGKLAPGMDVPSKGLEGRDARSAGQNEQFVNAMQFRQVPAVPYKDNKVDTGAAASLQQSLQQQANNYLKLPNAKSEYAAFLQQKADAFAAVTKDVIAHAASLESARISGTAGAEATAAGLKTTAEQSAMEPFKRKEREFQAGLSVNTEEAKNANTKNQGYWADPQHGYVVAKQQFDSTNASIDAARDGNGLLTSFVPTMEVLGMNVAAGVHRISPQESQAASLPGGYTERFNAWLDKASKGQLTPQLVAEGHQLVGILQNSAYNKVLAQSQMAAASGKIPYHQMPAMTPEGKITTLDRVLMPAGADVRVPGKDGKMYWGNSQSHAIIGPAE